MKYLYLFFTVVTSALILGCTTNENNELPTQIEVPQYHLKTVTGGIAGVNHNFDLDEIIWVFSPGSPNGPSLSVRNDNDNGLEDGLDTGTYLYSLIKVGETKEYLFVDGIEFGEVHSPDDSTLVIDRTSLSSTTVPDAYIYTFELRVITIGS